MNKLIALFSMVAIILGTNIIPNVVIAGGLQKLVIQVSTADPLTQKIAINNAVNFQKHYGPDNVDVIIVAYGPGLSLLTKKNKQAQRVKSLAIQGIKFNACGNTLKKIAKKKGKKPQLVKGVKVVPAGVVRISELQQKGYSYIRP